jgi:hypothetical protein
MVYDKHMYYLNRKKEKNYEIKTVENKRERERETAARLKND